ncbi:four-carbon acid sugar kinase family protein [Gracilibacillus sp. D59]|uniref:four-carbon acid sugar kinase family protein n=1 Tax=Gracilibacillus sp. D59 TaxID=3457434 RepID=UPI003FCDA08F
MKIAIIADDLSGANDTGVQFAKNGFKTSVLINQDDFPLSDSEVVVLDTDSRSISSSEAYLRVKAASQLIHAQPFEMVYKKIDSTLRGNIGVELNAVTDVFTPDFVIIAPAYPENERIVEDGKMYVQNSPLHLTEFASDPKTPISTSFIPYILQRDIQQEVGLVNKRDLEKGKAHILNKLEKWKEKNITYILFDSNEQSDLEKIVSFIYYSNFHLVWCGSAGLANAISCLIERRSVPPHLHKQVENGTILTVIGSVNQKTREQFDRLLSSQENKGIQLHSHLVVENEATCLAELQRVTDDVLASLSTYKSIVVYAAGNKREIAQAREIGKKYGLTSTMISDKISQSLGVITANVLEHNECAGLVLTGGDTARQVCLSLGIAELRLVSQLEEGIPVGVIRWKGSDLITITKAGGFGKVNALENAIDYLKGVNG